MTKQFFTEATGTPYSGSANFGSDPNNLRQHVAILDTTNESLPNRGSVSRGVAQNYRIRFEYDERPRLYGHDSATKDIEYDRELYQLNLELQTMGRAQYAVGNSIDETDVNQHQYKTGVTGHPGYIFTGTWAESNGIPNCMYLSLIHI